MSALQLEWSRSASRPFTIGVLLASATLASPSLAAQDERPPKPIAGPIGVEELNRDIRPRIRKLAEAVFADEKRWQESVELRIGPRIKGGGEEAVYRQAKLTREIAELESKEYNEVAAPLERVKLEDEIQLTEAAIRNAEEDLHGIEAIALKAKEIEPRSVLDVMSAYGVELMVKSAQRSLEKEKFGLEQAKVKPTIFDLSDKPMRITVLKSQIEKASSDELAKQQNFELRQSALASRKRAIEFLKKPQESSLAPIVKALGELIGMEAELHARMKEVPPADPKDRASWDEKSGALSNRLRAALGKAEQLRDDIEFDGLGRGIHQAASRAHAGSLLERVRMISPEDRKALASATPDWFGLLQSSAMIAPLDDGPRPAPISVEQLNRQVRPRIRRLAKTALEDRRPERAVLEDELTNRRIEQQGEEAAYQQAILTREVAEIAVKAYAEGIALQEQAVIAGELKLAEFAPVGSRVRVNGFEAILQEAKRFETTTIYEMTTVYDLEKSQRAARLQIRKDRIELEQARSRLKRFNEFQKPKRIKELQVEVEKASADESIKKESLDAFNEDFEILKRRAEDVKKRSTPDWEPVLSALDEAVGLERALQAQLKEIPPSDPKEHQSWDEKLGSQSVKLSAALDKAEQLHEDIDFEQLGGRIHELLRGVEASRTPDDKK